MTNNSQRLASWLKPVEKYLEIWKAIDEDGPPPGATREQLATLRNEAERQGLHIDDHVLEFLTLVSGTSFDRCNFAGASIPDDDIYCRTDLLASNRPDIRAAFGDVTIYGNRSNVIFYYNESIAAFQSIDGPDVIATFKTFGDMIQSVFESELSSLSDSAVEILRAKGVVL